MITLESIKDFDESKVYIQVSERFLACAAVNGSDYERLLRQYMSRYCGKTALKWNKKQVDIDDKGNVLTDNVTNTDRRKKYK